MTNPTDTKQQYEGAILQQLIKNSERLVTAENSLTEVKNDVAQLKNDVSQIRNDITQINQELAGVKETTQKVESAIGLLKWIGGGVAAILLSIIASFIYSFVS